MIFGVEQAIILFIVPLVFVAAIFLIIKRPKLAGIKKTYLIAYVIALSLLIIALSHPYVEIETNSIQNQQVQVFLDSSSSMEIYNVPELFERDIDIISIGRNESSNVYSNIMASLAPNSHGIIVSDGQKTQGQDPLELQELANSLNTTLYVVSLNQTQEEGSVTILGSDNVFPNVDEDFIVDVSEKLPQNTYLTVKINGNTIYDDTAKDYEFKQRLQSGQHTIEAEINSDDLYSGNNKFYKVVTVIERPKILYIGPSGDPLEVALSQLYHLEVRRNANNIQDAEEFHAVILNNMASPPNDLKPLEEFLTKGGGLFVIGGKNALSNSYKGEFEELLPVTIAGAVQDKDKASIILAIDISGSTGASFNTGSENIIVDIEKALSISIIDSLKDESMVGAVAFNTQSFLVAKPQPLSVSRNEIIDKISRLTHSGGTVISQAIFAARGLIQDDGDIILISDGKVNQVEDREVSSSIARNLALAGVKVHAISVGGTSDEVFLSSLAEQGQGYFFKPEEYQKFGIVFLDADEADASAREQLITLDSNHFITEGLLLESTIGSYNDVKPKNLAKKLVVTSNNRPALTTWRYGVGRVATFSVFDGNSLGNILEKDSELLVKATNWAVGNPQRKAQFSINIDPARAGEKVNVYIQNETVGDERFSQIDERLFFHEFEANESGIHEFLGVKYAVNYPKEYEKFEQSEELFQLAHATGGKVISPEEIGNINGVIEGREKTITLRNSLTTLVLVAALILALAGMITRKFMETVVVK